MKSLLYFFKRLPMRLVALVWFVMAYTKMKTQANIQVTFCLLQPKKKLHPGIVAYPLMVQSDFEIFLLSGLLTMIPATLSIDLTEDKKTLYIHGLFLQDPTQFIAQIHQDLETPIRNFCQ